MVNMLGEPQEGEYNVRPAEDQTGVPSRLRTKLVKPEYEEVWGLLSTIYPIKTKRVHELCGRPSQGVSCHGIACNGGEWRAPLTTATDRENDLQVRVTFLQLGE